MTAGTPPRALPMDVIGAVLLCALAVASVAPPFAFNIMHGAARYAGPLWLSGTILGLVALARRRRHLPLWGMVVATLLLLVAGGLGALVGWALWVTSGLPAAG